MARKFEIAADLLEHCGALPTVQELANHWGVHRTTADIWLKGVPKVGKRYFYEDVAAMLIKKSA